MHKAANAETTIITVPVEVMSNAVALQGALVKSIEIDFEVMIANLTSITAVVNQVARGTDTNVAVVTTPAFTQAPTAANAAIVNKHKLVITLTTPIYLLNTQYLLVQLTCVAPATTTLDFLGAVVNFNLKA